MGKKNKEKSNFYFVDEYEEGLEYLLKKYRKEKEHYAPTTARVKIQNCAKRMLVEAVVALEEGSYKAAIKKISEAIPLILREVCN